MATLQKTVIGGSGSTTNAVSISGNNPLKVPSLAASSVVNCACTNQLYLDTTDNLIKYHVVIGGTCYTRTITATTCKAI